MNKIIKYTAAVCAAFSLSVANAALVLSTDYESGFNVGTGVSGSIIFGGGSEQSSQGFGTGNFFRNDTLGITSINLSGLGTSHVGLTFDLGLFILDSWDGSTTTGGVVPPDFFNVIIDGTTVFSETFDNFVLSDGTSGLTPTVGPADLFSVGGSPARWLDSLYDLQLTVAHSSDTVNIQMFASGAGYQGGSDESWAIDNWSITTAVPEPSLIILFGTGLVGMGLIRRKRKI